MNVALQRPLSAVDLNFNPPSFPAGQLRNCAREHSGLEGELTPLDGERDQNHRLTTAEGANYVLKVRPQAKAKVPWISRSRRSAIWSVMPRTCQCRASSRRRKAMTASGLRPRTASATWCGC